MQTGSAITGSNHSNYPFFTLHTSLINMDKQFHRFQISMCVCVCVKGDRGREHGYVHMTSHYQWPINSYSIFKITFIRIHCKIKMRERFEIEGKSKDSTGTETERDSAILQSHYKNHRSGIQVDQKVEIKERIIQTNKKQQKWSEARVISHYNYELDNYTHSRLNVWFNCWWIHTTCACVCVCALVCACIERNQHHSRQIAFIRSF